MSGSLEAPRPPWRDEYLHDLPALHSAVAGPINNFAKCHLVENFEIGFDPNWRPSASARRKGAPVEISQNSADLFCFWSFCCLVSSRDSGVGDVRWTCDAALRIFRDGWLSYWATSWELAMKSGANCGPKLISLNNSRPISTRAPKTRRARFAIRDDGTSNQLIQ
jgi:hypothetical protein